MKYHISPKTGNPNRCYANTKPCPIGGEGEHYSTKDAARAAFEKDMNTLSKPLSKTVSTQSTVSHLDDRETALIEKNIQNRNSYTPQEKQSAQKSLIQSVQALKTLNNGKVAPTNGGAMWRSKIQNSTETAEVSVNRNGNINFRVFDEKERIGYGENNTWEIPKRNSPEQVVKDFKNLISQVQEKENKNTTPTPTQTTINRKKETINVNSKFSHLKGPNPEKIEEKFPSYESAGYQCSNCGNKGKNLMSESYNEGFDGESPCCNERLDSVSIKVNATNDFSFKNKNDAALFVKENRIDSYQLKDDSNGNVTVSTDQV